MYETTFLILTGILTALLTGLYFGYAVSVNPGLGRLKNSEYVAAMQSINIVIQNPYFFLSFFGPVILLPLVTFFNWENTFSLRFFFLLGASIFYIVGSFGVTVFGNVPLNEKLKLLDVKTASVETIAQARKHYEKPWNRLHAVRTCFSIIALMLLLVAFVTN